MSSVTAAIGYLRQLTLGRAARAYFVWVGRAIGWWTIVYLIFWLVVFALSGLEMVKPLPRALPAGAALAPAVLAGLLFLTLSLSGRAPPLALDRRDLYRLGLAPVPPGQVLRLRLNLKRLGALAFGSVLGGVWSLLAPAYLHLAAPFAAPAAALVALAYVELSWLRYAGYRRAGADGRWIRRATGLLLGAASLSAAGAAWAAVRWSAQAAAAGLESAAVAAPWPARLGLLGALVDASLLTLAAPVVFALLALAATRLSLKTAWPPRFLAQSLLLGQLQAMRAFQLIAGLAGMAGLASAREVDAAMRQRLLATLHDRPGALRPRRSLPLPRAELPAWRAIAWRSASAIYRRPLLGLFGLALFLLGSAAALMAAGRFLADLAGPVPAGAAAISLGAALSGALGVLLAAFMAARAGAALLGPALGQTTLPVEPLARTAGRLAPALALLSLMLLPGQWLASALRAILARAAGPEGAGGDAAGLLALAGQDVLVLPVLSAALVLLVTCLLALEKYSSWSGAGASRLEPQLVAALVTALPVLLMAAFGVPGWTLAVQLALLAVLWLIPV